MDEFVTVAEVKEDYKHSKLVFPGTQRGMEIDVFIPELNLGFEYQGEQHFQDIGYFGPKMQYTARDNHKREACESQGITLVEIPYWWNRLIYLLFKLTFQQESRNCKREDSNSETRIRTSSKTNICAIKTIVITGTSVCRATAVRDVFVYIDVFVCVDIQLVYIDIYVYGRHLCLW